MPRRTRIHIAGLPLHIVQRGHNRSARFFAEEDYLCYLHWLAEAVKDTDCALHAYVLMTNHVHLLLTPTHAESVSRFIMALGRRYVQYINKTQGRTGTLWDSRYKSSLIDADDYLLSCQRYIEMNPVRAGMVDDPAHYRWSSYRHNALGSDEPARSKQYRALFRSQLASDPITDIRMALQQSQSLGNSRFAEKITRWRGSIVS
jgi:putative transposase